MKFRWTIPNFHGIEYTMIERTSRIRDVKRLLGSYRVVAVIGARQIGKTTLAREIADTWRGRTTVFDLEDPRDRSRLEEPMLTLQGLSGFVVIDEVQHSPDLFPILRVLVDRPRTSIRFLLLGSASPDLLRQSSETLAGRIAYYELTGFNTVEVGIDNLDKLWLRGRFPRSFLARSNPTSSHWRREFIRTFLERDIPQLGITIPAETMRRFWTMLAHYHGQIWNASEFARSFGVTDKTVRRYLDILTSTFVVRRLQPFHENLRKRQVKAPKFYISDSGILHTLLNLDTSKDLEGHPKVGASWEGFAMEEIIQRVGARPDECYFWATHTGAELDLLITRGLKRIGFEFKRTVAPKVTTSMRSAISDLHLDQLFVTHAGTESFPMGDKIRAIAVTDIQKELKPLR